MNDRFRKTPAGPFSAWALGMGLGLMFSTTGFAQTSAAGASHSTPQWSLGAGAVTWKKVYRGIDRDSFVLPLVTYESKWVSFGFPSTDFKMYSNDAVSLRLRARFDFEGFNPQDSSFLAGMEKRKRSIWTGAAFLWRNEIANVSAELLADAMNNSRGTRASLQLDRRFTVGAVGLSPRVGVEWYDRKFVDYYYGVRASESTAVRSAYSGQSTTALNVGVRLDYSPVARHTILLDIAAKRLGSSIKDSPIVERSTQTMLGLGYLYHF